MAYDIYGDILLYGYCEVHPWIAQEYPCYLCLHEYQNNIYNKEQEQLYNNYCEQQFLRYCEEQLYCLDGDGI